MKPVQRASTFSSFGDVLIAESTRYGPVITVAVMSLISFGALYLAYGYFLEGWVQSNEEYRQQVIRKEIENDKTERMLAGEPHFRAEFKKIFDLYEEAKPLLPQETEVSDVLGQVEMAAKRNGVTLTGLMAVKESVKSSVAEKVYEREIPAIVTGPYPQVVNFFADISRMPRILLVRDFSVVSLKTNVSAGFTLVAYHAPPPAEMPDVPKELAVNSNAEANR
ncbi:MAG TPA: type 4a pilus biogenesis protein PilO [Pyrinomonadaceae bacterium]